MVRLPGSKRISMTVSERAGSPALLSTPSSRMVVGLRTIQPASGVSSARAPLPSRLLALVTARSRVW